MRGLIARGRWSLFVAALASVGCGEGELGESDGGVGTLEQNAYAVNGIWPAAIIHVCWENPANHNATERGWVRDAVEATWQRAAAIEFIGWDRCGAATDGVRIRIEDTAAAPSSWVGATMDGRVDGMHLNFTFRNWSPSCRDTRQDCIEDIAVHEFGHTLGLAHEQDRPDTPGWCEDQEGAPAESADILIGDWDEGSVMNYCNEEWNNDGALSPTDEAAADQLYGQWNQRGAFTRYTGGAGGDGETLNCPKGYVGIGVSTVATAGGSFVGMLGVRCAPEADVVRVRRFDDHDTYILASGFRDGATGEVFPPTAGWMRDYRPNGPRGLRDTTCDPGYVLDGLYVKAAALVDRVVHIHCARMARIGGAAGYYRAVGTGGNGGSYVLRRCADGGAVTALHFRSGWNLDGFALGCEVR